MGAKGSSSIEPFVIPTDAMYQKEYEEALEAIELYEKLQEEEKRERLRNHSLGLSTEGNET